VPQRKILFCVCVWLLSMSINNQYNVMTAVIERPGLIASFASHRLGGDRWNFLWNLKYLQSSSPSPHIFKNLPNFGIVWRFCIINKSSHKNWRWSVKIIPYLKDFNPMITSNMCWSLKYCELLQFYCICQAFICSFYVWICIWTSMSY